MSLALIDGRSADYGSEAREFIEGESHSLRWIPSQAAHKFYDDVPHLIAETAAEAHACHSIAAYRGAIILARAAVEASAKEKGAEGGSLVKRIDSLLEKGIITEAVADTAHTIRDYGNDAAHHNFTEEVTEGESEEILELMAQVLRAVFQDPTRLAALKAARLAKLNQVPSAT